MARSALQSCVAPRYHDKKPTTWTLAWIHFDHKSSHAYVHIVQLNDGCHTDTLVQRDRSRGQSRHCGGDARCQRDRRGLAAPTNPKGPKGQAPICPRFVQAWVLHVTSLHKSRNILHHQSTATTTTMQQLRALCGALHGGALPFD